MTGELGPLQLKLLAALRRHASESTLENLVAFAAGFVPDLATRPPINRKPPRAVYASTARAVAALRRRGLVQVRSSGTAKGRIQWLPTPSGRLHGIWRFRHPAWRLRIWATC
jgi:hypothetical protein